MALFFLASPSAFMRPESANFQGRYGILRVIFRRRGAGKMEDASKRPGIWIYLVTFAL